jgi:hypothetical protein
MQNSGFKIENRRGGVVPPVKLGVGSSERRGRPACLPGFFFFFPLLVGGMQGGRFESYKLIQDC